MQPLTARRKRTLTVPALPASGGCGPAGSTGPGPGLSGSTGTGGGDRHVGADDDR